MYEAVVLDWDGTLADTKRAILFSFKKALETLSIRVRDDFVNCRIGIGAEGTFKEILQSKGKRPDEAIIKRLVQKKIRSEIDMSNTVRLLPGALELLQCLHGRIKMGLASMNNRIVVDHMLDRMNLTKYFNAVLTVEDVLKFKPDPEIFLKCASRLATNPLKSVVIEDSIFGVQAAKAARMSCIAVGTGAYNRDELKKAGAELVVNSLAELDAILLFIFN